MIKVKKIWVIFFTIICVTFGAGQSVDAKSQQVTFSFPIKIKWGHSGLVKGQKYQFELKGLKPNTPMPKGSNNEEYTFSVQEKDTMEYIPKITYKGTGDYQYKLTLYRDKNIVIKTYYFHIQVLNKGNGELFLVTSIRKNTQAGAKIAETNFLDIGEDKPWKEEDHEKNKYDHKKDKNSHEISDKNKKKKTNIKRKEERITKNARTGDEMKVEFYLFASIISLSVILIIGGLKISHRE